MLITVKAKPGAKQARIEKLSENNFSVWVKEKPQDGKANCAVQEALAHFLHLPKSRIALLRGQKSKIKVFEIS